MIDTWSACRPTVFVILQSADQRSALPWIVVLIVVLIVALIVAVIAALIPAPIPASALQSRSPF